MTAYQWAVEMADGESEGGGADVAQKSGTLGHGCDCCPCMGFLVADFRCVRSSFVQKLPGIPEATGRCQARAHADY